MELIALIAAFGLIVLGFIGCVVPVLPGLILAYCGLLCLLLTERAPSIATLVMFGALIAVVTVLDYVVPAIGARRFNCSKWGAYGCLIGTLAGLFFLPLGLLIGPFAGAFLVELIMKRSVGAAAYGGLGALLGFLSGMFIKLAACAAILVFVFNCL